MSVSPANLSPTYAEAWRLIDDAHAADPNRIAGPGGLSSVPYELHYSQKMTKWLQSRCPDASPALQLACRAQHFRRYVSLMRRFHYTPNLVQIGNEMVFGDDSFVFLQKNLAHAVAM